MKALCRVTGAARENRSGQFGEHCLGVVFSNYLDLYGRWARGGASGASGWRGRTTEWIMRRAAASSMRSTAAAANGFPLVDIALGLQLHRDVPQRALAPVDRVARELLRQHDHRRVALGVALAAAALAGLALLAIAGGLELGDQRLAFSNCDTAPSTCRSAPPSASCRGTSRGCRPPPASRPAPAGSASPSPARSGRARTARRSRR